MTPASRVRAFIFDLDGTLVETELLKARAYAAVAGELLGRDTPDTRALALYERIVGATDESAARAMVEELSLADALAGRCGTPWEALGRLQRERYEAEFATGEALRAAAYPHTLDLVRREAAAGMKVAVATSSFTEPARRVVRELGVLDLLDALVGRDQVKNGKPDPEIYARTMELLGVDPAETVVIEDSVTGLEAAVRSGARCVAISSAFSADGLRRQSLLDQRWCVYRPERLAGTVEQRLRD